jgi:L-idonate 5-dehydrogenase
MSADGGMADFLVAEGSVCAPVGADVALERAVLVEPFAVALHGVHQVDVAGRRVAVIGIGSLGLCLVEAAVLAGAAEVIAVSRSEVARGAALEGGASAALPPDDAGDVDAEVVFETAGAAPAIAPPYAGAGGSSSWGVTRGSPRSTCWT